MELSRMQNVKTLGIHLPHPRKQIRTQISSFSSFNGLVSEASISSIISNSAESYPTFLSESDRLQDGRSRIVESIVPMMSDIMEASKLQNLDVQLQTLGPFFRITARNLETRKEVGRAEGLVRVWLGGKILHLDSIRLRRETLGMEKSIFGIGLFIGAVAVRHGYDCGCTTAELLAINDTDLYHAKLVKFYTRIGFKAVYEVTGSSLRDVGHMLVWGGVGTIMDANVEELMLKWCTRFKPKNPPL